jgi:tetratricopeptide (TPR) repeat protein
MIEPSRAVVVQPKPRERLYRQVFVVGLALYLLSFVVGVGYVLAKRHRLPGFGLETLDQAAEFEKQGDLRSAAREYRMMTRLVPNNYGAFKKLAEILGRTEGATADIDKYLRARDIWPRDAAVHRSLAWAFFSQKRYAEATASFRDALRYDPQDAAAQAGIGEAALDQDRYAEAVEAFRAALRLTPDNAAFHNSLGITYALSGRHPESVEQFEAAVRLDPNPEFKANLDRARAEASR